MIVPIKQAKQKAKKTYLRPSTIHSKPNNFISQAPIPPLLIIIISAINKKDALAPTIGDHQESKVSRIRRIIKMGKKKSNTLSGISMYEISETNIIISIETKLRASSNSKEKPIL